MRRPLLHAPRGLPGSGKSTLARRLAAATGAAHVELDAIRRLLWPGAPPDWDPHAGLGLEVRAAFEAELAALLAAGRDVIADRGHVSATGWLRLQQLVAGRAEIVVHDLRSVPLAVCVARDALRPDETRVGGGHIRALHAAWVGGVR